MIARQENSMSELLKENVTEVTENANKKVKLRDKAKSFLLKKRVGALNTLEIIILSIITIAVAWIFRDELIAIVETMSTKLTNSINDLFVTT